jgi:hypothetical protein
MSAATPDKVRAEVLRAIDATTLHVGDMSARLSTEWRLRAALAFMSGYLRDAEPEMADKLKALLKAADA